MVTFVVLIAGGSLLAGCAAPRGTPPEPSGPLTDAPGRIVSTAPAVTEILFAIGAGERVVGVDDWSNFPPDAEKLPRIGPYYPLTLEKILALQPDLVVGMAEQQEWLDALEQRGLKVLAIAPRSTDGVLAAFLLVGGAVGNLDAAERLSAAVDQRMRQVGERIRQASGAERPRVWCELSYDPLMTAGPHTLIGQLIVAAGGVNIAADAETDYPTMSPEEIVVRDPQVIIIPDRHEAGNPTLQEVRERPGWATLSAVRAGRVYVVNSDILCRPGPRVAEAVEMLAGLFYPEESR